MMKKTLLTVLLALYVGYYGSTVFFVHTHQFEWGMVTHAHPYTSRAHAHNINALLLIDSLQKLLFVSMTAAFCLALPFVVAAFGRALRRMHIIRFLQGCRLLRAPPTV
jgi:Sec-independent protein secretion pathway component TatC